MVHEALRQEISGLKVSSERFLSAPIPARSPARDDDDGGHQWTHLRCEGSEGSKGCGGGFAANYKNAAPTSVISTKAGQPPIGKPLIVQARGQLRLTWRLYAESPQSGEISLPNGT